jgi:1-deoxyxylulose-5-phosphate synthase
MIPLRRDQAVALLTYSPLARDTLIRAPALADRPTASARQATDPLARQLAADREVAVVAAVAELAVERGVSQARVAMAWLLDRPGVVAPIVGATKVGHLEEAVAAAELVLTESENASLGASYLPQVVSGRG